MRTAFKEWAVIVDALGQGGQILILRKGGLREGPAGFQVEQPDFLLFPTLFHQQRESVLPEAQARFDVLAPDFPPPEIVRLDFCARVVEARRLASRAAAERLRGQHCWRDEVIAKRFDWGGEQGIFALAIRVFRLPRSVTMPMSPAYAGCKSWVELESDIETHEARPVLDEAGFAPKLAQFRAALGTA